MTSAERDQTAALNFALQISSLERVVVATEPGAGLILVTVVSFTKLTRKTRLALAVKFALKSDKK